MKVTIELNNKTSLKISSRLLEKVTKISLEGSGFSFLQPKKIEISFAFVKADEIRLLNRRHRKINKATDVLSFSEYKTTADLKKERKGAIFLGEVIICPEYIRKCAVTDGINFQKELIKVISHGVLHLAGFKHGRKMFEIQDNVMLH